MGCQRELLQRRVPAVFTNLALDIKDSDWRVSTDLNELVDDVPRLAMAGAGDRGMQRRIWSSLTALSVSRWTTTHCVLHPFCYPAHPVCRVASAPGPVTRRARLLCAGTDGTSDGAGNAQAEAGLVHSVAFIHHHLLLSSSLIPHRFLSVPCPTCLLPRK